MNQKKFFIEDYMKSLVCLCLVLFLPSAFASSVVLSETDEDLVKYAEKIFIARVIRVESTENYGGFCFSSFVKVEPLSSLKGKTESVEFFLTNETDFVEGGKYLIFLRRWEGRSYAESCPRQGVERYVANGQPLFLPSLTINKYVLIEKDKNIDHALLRSDRCPKNNDVLLMGKPGVRVAHAKELDNTRKPECAYFFVEYRNFKDLVMEIIEKTETKATP